MSATQVGPSVEALGVALLLLLLQVLRGLAGSEGVASPHQRGHVEAVLGCQLQGLGFLLAPAAEGFIFGGLRASACRRW